MIGSDCQGTTNTQQHNRFSSAEEDHASREKRWGESIIRHEDMDETDHVDNEIDAAHEVIHMGIVHFIS